MEDNMQDLIPVPEAARRASVSRNTMHRAAKSGAIKAIKLGRDWFVYTSDIERWKSYIYRPDMALKHPVKKSDEENDKPAPSNE